MRRTRDRGTEVEVPGERDSKVFKFLVTMDVADVERMLDDRMFSGPAQLGPIAGAIRGKAKEYRDAAIDHS